MKTLKMLQKEQIAPCEKTFKAATFTCAEL